MCKLLKVALLLFLLGLLLAGLSVGTLAAGELRSATQIIGELNETISSLENILVMQSQESENNKKDLIVLKESQLNLQSLNDAKQRKIDELISELRLLKDENNELANIISKAKQKQIDLENSYKNLINKLERKIRLLKIQRNVLAGVVILFLI